MSKDNEMPPKAAIDGHAEEILDRPDRKENPMDPRTPWSRRARPRVWSSRTARASSWPRRREVAEALVDVVRRQRLYVDIRGNEHPQVEAWQALGALLGPFNAAVLTRLGQVDIVQRLPGLPGWERLVAESERYELGDISVAVLARSTLIELKRRRGSGQDMADIEAIELLDRLEG
jgi:hypothetical protein